MNEGVVHMSKTNVCIFSILTKFIEIENSINICVSEYLEIYDVINLINRKYMM